MAARSVVPLKTARSRGPRASGGLPVGRGSEEEEGRRGLGTGPLREEAEKPAVAAAGDTLALEAMKTHGYSDGRVWL